MIKNKLIKLLCLLVSMATIVSCDAWSTYITVKQSINNLSSDTIIVSNSKNEILGFKIEDTIICLPFSETIFFDTVLHKQPLEPYNSYFISRNTTVNTSSNRNLAKDILDDKNWNFIKNRKQELLIFTITESDLE